jgi:hypothetical protein
VAGNRWTIEERNILSKLYQNTPTSGIALLLGRSEHSIEHQASLSGFSKGEALVTKARSLGQNKNYHCEPYLTFRRLYVEDRMSIRRIAKQVGCSITKVQKYLEREGLTRSNLESKKILSQQSQYNSTFFDIINTQEKAYWLGFFYADGYLRKDGSTVQLTLAVKDLEHLQHFADVFHRKVAVYQRAPDKRTGKVYISSSCMISCAHLWNTLREKGIKQVNTLSGDISIFDHVTEELIHHFVRGFFDGDGTVYRNKSGGLEFGFVGSMAFMQHLSEVLSVLVRLPPPKIGKNRKLAAIRWSGNRRGERFKTWLYQDATIWLKRKREVFEN